MLPMADAVRSNRCPRGLGCRSRLWLVTLVCSWAWLAGSICHAGEDGHVSGIVKYVADAKQPWRYQRYYVPGRDKGPLAEAVVVLRGSALKNWPAAPMPQTVEMDQLNFQFVPETLAIRRGDTVRFTNSDSTTHNVRSTAAIAPFNVNLGAEDDYTHTFERAGGLATPVTLGCAYHGGMRAWIYVFDDPFFAVTAADGAFHFENVPPGEYTLQMIHPAGQLQWKVPLTLTAGGRQSMSIDVSPKHRTLK